MSSLRLWIMAWLVTGGAIGYVVASGLGVAFEGQSPLPFSEKIGWWPIAMMVFLFALRLVFHQEFVAGIDTGEAKEDAKPQDD